MRNPSPNLVRQRLVEPEHAPEVSLDQGNDATTGVANTNASAVRRCAASTLTHFVSSVLCGLFRAGVEALPAHYLLSGRHRSMHHRAAVFSSFLGVLRLGQLLVCGHCTYPGSSIETLPTPAFTRNPSTDLIQRRVINMPRARARAGAYHPIDPVYVWVGGGMACLMLLGSPETLLLIILKDMWATQTPHGRAILAHHFQNRQHPNADCPHPLAARLAERVPSPVNGDVAHQMELNRRANTHRQSVSTLMSNSESSPPHAHAHAYDSVSASTNLNVSASSMTKTPGPPPRAQSHMVTPRMRAASLMRGTQTTVGTIVRIIISSS
ncbi:hypothetical protein K438DRAFT_2086410 [Mycena galopus ATCC 62051]|nr:hypothetical protein K438DRAFT_2086410 [Mycena galopus ATCC 62051]